MNYTTAIKFNSLPYDQKLIFIMHKFNIKTIEESKLCIESIQIKAFEIIGKFQRALTSVNFHRNPRISQR